MIYFVSIVLKPKTHNKPRGILHRLYSLYWEFFLFYLLFLPYYTYKQKLI